MPVFCFSCGRKGYGLKDCTEVPVEFRDLSEEDLPYSAALKAESTLLGKVNLKLGFNVKKSVKQCYYLGDDE